MRVEVEKTHDPGRRHHDQRRLVDPRFLIGDPPGDGRERGKQDLDIRTGEGHQEAFPFLGEQPGVAHIAIETRLEVHEQKSDLVDFAAEVLAGEPVGAFMHGRGRQDRDPHPQHRLETDHGAEITPDFFGIRQGKAPAEQDQGGRTEQERRGETESDPVDHAVEEPIGIEDFDAGV
jgi:hypothetical protein